MLNEVISNYLKCAREQIRETYAPLKGKDVVIWGTGDYGKMIYGELSDIGANVLCFCDDTKETCEKKKCSNS